MKRTKFSDPSLKTMRYRIVQEIRDSERTYVTALHTAILLFLDPLEKAVARSRRALSLTHDTTILSQAAIDDIFSNIRDVACVATDVLQELEVVCHPQNYSDETLIGSLFLRLLDLPEFVATYTKYVEDYSRRLEVLSGSLPQSFTEFRLTQEASTHCGNHTLSSFLVQPIQRIPRYTLLIRDLLKHTDADHADYKHLEEAAARMEEFTESLEIAKKQADDKAELLKQLDSMGSKERAQLGLEDSQIIASGPVRWRSKPGSDLKTRFLILFNDKVVCCKRSRIFWQANLQNCKVSRNGDHIALTEVRPIDEYPYAKEQTNMLYPLESPPYDMGFWYNNLESAMSTFWFDDSKMMESSSTFAMSMRLNLLTEKDMAILKIGFPKKAYGPGDVVIEEGTQNSSIYYIESGCVQVQKEHMVTGKTQVLTTMEEGEFMGEFAFLKPPGMRMAEATVVANPTERDPAILCCMDMDALADLFQENATLALKFYKLQACVLANRFTLQHFMRFRNEAVLGSRRQSLATIQDLIASDLFADSESGTDDSSELPDAEDELECFEPDEECEDTFATVKEGVPDVGVTGEDAGVTGAEEANIDTSSSNSSSKPLYPVASTLSAGRRQSAPSARRRSSVALVRQRYPAIAKAVPASEALVEEFRAIAKGPGLPDTHRARLLVLENYVVFHWKQFLKANVVAIHRSKLASVSVHAEDSRSVIISTLTFSIYLVQFEHDEPARQAAQLIQRLVGANDNGPQQSPRVEALEEDNRMELNDSDWELLMTVGEVKVFEEGTAVIKYRKPVSHLFHVKSGQGLAFIDRGTAADRLRGEVVDEGEVLGEITFVQGGVATATVEIMSETATMICFERQALFDLLEREPRLGSKFYRLLSLFLAERFLAVQSGMML